MAIELRQSQDLEELVERSHTAPVLIFKHSTHCPLSAAALDELHQFAEAHRETICGVVPVIESRRLSSQIEHQFRIRHESPQALLLSSGVCIWSASHWKITSDALRIAVQSTTV